MERETAECGPERMVELLLAAVPEDLDRFERLCGKVQDWEKLTAYARSQGDRRSALALPGPCPGWGGARGEKRSGALPGRRTPGADAPSRCVGRGAPSARLSRRR